MTICFVFASRSRSARFYSVLENIRDMSTDSGYFIVAKIDEDDPEFNKYLSRIKDYPEVILKIGYSKSKIDAINRDFDRLPHYDIICVVSDDQLFIERGFDRKIKEQFSDGLDWFLHFKEPYANSQASKHGGEEVCVMSIIGKEYYDRDGYVYFPKYYSMFCDEEATQVAKIRGRYKYIEEPIYCHYHYSQSDPTFRIYKDQLYKRNDTYRQDEKIFIDRKKINFGLPKSINTDAAAEKGIV
jgi:hypothetical protein